MARSALGSFAASTTAMLIGLLVSEPTLIAGMVTLPVALGESVIVQPCERETAPLITFVIDVWLEPSILKSFSSGIRSGALPSG